MSIVKLLQGDSLDKLKEIPDNSIDSICCDPPYGISFMNSKWDYDVPSVKIWRECMRVLKPGGHLLAFAGSRTYHVMAMRIENAGFDIVDQIMWIYGSGFPKSQNISKMIDKKAGAKRDIVDKRITGGALSKNLGTGNTPFASGNNEVDITTPATPATPAAKKWEGWGTALKPAHEPIVVAQKPISEKTIEFNILKWGVGAINILASKIGSERLKAAAQGKASVTSFHMEGSVTPERIGRWPANILFDENASRLFENSKFFYVAKPSPSERNAGLEALKSKPTQHDGRPNPVDVPQQRGQNQNHHPTLKPIKLMEYLVRLVTPPGGTVLDPFMGSGTTGCAAVNLGFEFVGCELSPEYFEIATKRIDFARKTALRLKPILRKAEVD